MSQNEPSNEQFDQEIDDIKAKPISKPPLYNKRSSLKQGNNLSPLKNIPKKSKRGSVNWDISSLDNIKSLNLKEMKISFKQETVYQDKRKYSDFNLSNIVSIYL